MKTPHTLHFKRLHPDAVLPTQALEGSAGYDLCSVSYITVEPGRSETINTGLAVEIPSGFVGLIFSRSGHGFKHGVTLANSVGVLDSDYRGPVKIKLRNDGDQNFDVEPKHKVCQLVIVPFLSLTPEWVDELPDSLRGEGGFGSTGK